LEVARYYINGDIVNNLLFDRPNKIEYLLMGFLTFTNITSDYFVNLKYLHVFETYDLDQQLNDDILSNFKNLKYLSLKNNNRLTGSSFPKLKYLKAVYLNNNRKIYGNLFKHCKNLEILSLWGKSIIGYELKYISNIKELTLTQSTNIKNCHLKYLNNIRELTLPINNYITNYGLEHLCLNTNINYIGMRMNFKITEKGINLLNKHKVRYSIGKHNKF
jgi:hypothetical protein